MPGIDKNRFVNLLPEMEDEFTCGICHGVFDTPVVVPCCQQTYCRECITVWVNAHYNCPNDRSPLGANQLMPAPKIITNMLSKLMIHCRYSADGCSHVCSLELEDKHLSIDCEYNPKRLCSNCGALKDLNSDHNCVQHLYGLVRSSVESTRDVLTGIVEFKELVSKREDELMKLVDNLSVTINSLLSKVAKMESNVNVMKYVKLI